MAFPYSKLKIGVAALLLLAAPAVWADPGSIELFLSNSGSQNQDYVDQAIIPAGFGDGEFTLEFWILPNDSFPVGPVTSGVDQRTNWAIEDVQPYSDGDWWYKGNFLLDGHNNGSGFSQGTFSLQFYGGGRVRWLFGDNASGSPSGGVWSAGAYPASSAPSLLDGSWHHITLVRRWSGVSDAQLELWIDGVLIDTETTPARVNMRQFWDTWPGFPSGQEGWFWGAEKQAAIGSLSQYEDYKGLLDEIRFWSRAKTAGEISSNFAQPVTGSEPGLVARFAFGESQGTSICDSIDPGLCMFLTQSGPSAWSANGAPITTGSDTTPPTTPTNLQGQGQSQSEISLTWTASTDNVAVSSYVVRRDNVVIGNTANTSIVDTGLQPGTSYTYTVSARDAAGNVSPESPAINASTLAAPDTQAPSTPANLQGTAISATRIDLTWNASSDNIAVTGYTVRRDGVIIGSPTGTSFSDTGLTGNTSYAYTVDARDQAGNVSPQSTTVQINTLAAPDTQAPSTPANLQGTAISATRIDLTWNASSDNIAVTGYTVRRDGVIIGSPTGTSFSDTGLTGNTSYAYTVDARDQAGNVSPQSTTVQINTLAAPDTQAPSTPANLQGTAISATRIDLTWNASSDNVAVTGYTVRRDGVVVGSPTGTSFSDTGLTGNTSYAYTVDARDQAGNVSPQSTALQINTLATPDTQAPSTPANLQGAAISETRIDLTWNASSDNVAVTGYTVRRDGVVVGSPTGTSFSDTGLTANTGYAYTVDARDQAGNVSPQSTALQINTLAAPDTQAPSTPANLQGTAISATRIDLTWNASSDNVAVTGYTVRRDGVVVGSPTGTSFSDTGLTANTGYAYTVDARDQAGNVSPQSTALQINTLAAPDTQAPSTPANLQGTAISATRIDLTWNASSDNIAVTGYTVRRDGVVVGSPTGTSFSDTGLTANTGYAYTVDARDQAGNVSPQSTTVQISTLATPDTQAPSTPANLQGTAISATRIDLTWNASSDNIAVTGYTVRRDGVVVGSPTGTSFSDTGLTANTGYAYTVDARDQAGNVSPQSTTVQISTLATPDTQAPSTPANLQGTAISETRIDLTWNASSDNVAVTGYTVRRDGVVVGSPTGTSFSDTGLTANTGYAYTVDARDQAGNVSPQSTALQINTLAAPDTEAPTTPTNLQGSAFSSTAIDLNWTASTDNISVAEYDIRRNGVVVAITPSTSFQDTALSPGTSYAYTVSARDVSGNMSPESATIDVTTNTDPIPPPPLPPLNTGGIGGTGWLFLISLALILARRPALRRPQTGC